MAKASPPADDPTATRTNRVIVLLLLAVIGVALVVVVSDLLLALFLAAVFSGLLQPIYQRTQRWFGGRRTLAATVVLTTAVVAVGVPLAGLVTLVVAEALEVGEAVGPYLDRLMSEGFDVDSLMPAAWAERLEPYRSRIASNVGDWANTATSAMVESVARATQGTAIFVVKLGVMLYAMFFFLRDGPAWLERTVGYLPLGRTERQTIIDRGLSVIAATLETILVVGVVQGLLVGLGFWITGVPGAAFWGALVVPASAIPGLGTPLVWGPGAIYLLVRGDLGWAIALTVWGATVVSVIDNVLRARLVGATTRMSDLLVLVATLGGIGSLGPVGIIVGPALAGLLLTVLDIYEQTFRDFLTRSNNRVVT